MKKPIITKIQISNILNKSYLAKWFSLSILIGIVAGFGSVAFYYLIYLVEKDFFIPLTNLYPPNPIGEIQLVQKGSPHLLFIPIATALGGLISGAIVYTLAPEAEGHGTDAAIFAYHNTNGYIRKRIPIIKMLASAITIGMGGSAGREGPTAQISAGFGSFLGSALGLSNKDRRTLVAVGIGAGIGSIFRSPFGGAVLSAEILYSGGDMEIETIIPSFIASPIGYVIFAIFTSFQPIFGNFQYQFSNPFNILIFIILGFLVGFVGRFYSWSFYKTRDFFIKLHVPKILKPFIGMTLVGIIAIFFPEIIGMGYGYLQYLIEGNLNLITSNYITIPILILIFILIFVKIFATSLTVGSGGSGGVFAPSLVIGGFTGAFLWLLIKLTFPTYSISLGAAVVIGMMAMIAGVGRIPIASILMISEMTNSMEALIPGLIAVAISYYVVSPKYSIYRSQVLNRAYSPAHLGEYSNSILKEIKLSSIVSQNYIKTSQNEKISSLYEKLKEKGYKVAIVFENEKVQGYVTLEDIKKIPEKDHKNLFVSNMETRLLNIIDIRRTAQDALVQMKSLGVNFLIVYDVSKLVGIVEEDEIFRYYNKKYSSYNGKL